MAQLYKEGTVRALLESDLVTPATRTALRARLEERIEGPRFFSEALFATLRAACAHLIPQERPEPVEIAGAIDRRLAEGKGDGWRYADMPPDEEAYRSGLALLDAASAAARGLRFPDLAPADQDALLGLLQRGELPSGTWDSVRQRRFFQELLAEAAEIYYSHPLAQEEIGYAGMADAHGWQAIGLNELAPHEPRLRGGETAE
jgi:gluconate 2-dehydrogenase gamma chain